MLLNKDSVDVPFNSRYRLVVVRAPELQPLIQGPGKHLLLQDQDERDELFGTGQIRPAFAWQEIQVRIASCCYGGLLGDL
jgi:hypothetical protein